MLPVQNESEKEEADGELTINSVVMILSHPAEDVSELTYVPAVLLVIPSGVTNVFPSQMEIV